MRSSHETAEYCDNAPSDEDSGNPDTCSNPVQQKITGDLKDEIAKKENSGDESVLLARNRQFLVHRQGSERDVISVEHSNYEENEDERNDPCSHLADRASLDCSSMLWIHREGLAHTPVSGLRSEAILGRGHRQVNELAWNHADGTDYGIRLFASSFRLG